MTIKNSIPTTRRDNVTDILHGVEVHDPYRWLEDQDSPETRAWLDEQIAYTHQTLAGYMGRDEIRDRLAELMKVDSTSQPLERNGVYYYVRRRPNEQQYTIYKRCSANGNEEVLVDPHPMSGDHTTSVSLFDVSQDGGLVVYGVRKGGADELEVRIRNAETLLDLPDVLPAARYYGFVLSADSSAFYYSISTSDGPRVRKHSMGAGVDTDIEIFGAGLGPDKILGITSSEVGRYLLLTVFHGSSGAKMDLYISDLIADTPIRPIVDSIEARFSAQAAGDTLFVLTNWNAPNGRMLRISVDAPSNSPDAWLEIVPEKTNAILREFALTGGNLFLNYLQSASSHVEIADSDGRKVNEVALPGIGAVSGPVGRWSSPDIFFAFSSFGVPPTIFKFNNYTGECAVWAKSDLPLNSDEIKVDQVWYKSKDGTRVPMFLAHIKNLAIDGNRPAYMTAYGGFNASKLPAFSALAVLWAELGGIFALPSLRGGGEFGEEWHKAGMLEKKQNVFDDFYAAAEWLVDSGYTQPRKIAIAGGSNGGLLVGAAITQRPELFGAVLCGYPLLDMIRYQKFLVASFWVPEYGSSDDPEQFKYLYAYSPYHHVEESRDYPAIMFVTGDSDTRVAPLHARKMAALMQANSGSGNPVLLHYDVNSGHSEGKPMDQTVEDTTDEILFLLRNLGA